MRRRPSPVALWARRWAAASLCSILCLVAPDARAQDEADEAAGEALEEARHHFQQGVALFHDGDLEAALAEFRASYELNPLPQVLYNIAVAQRDLHRYAEAVETLERYLEEGTEEPQERLEIARELRIELQAVLADVTLSCDQPGADLFVDGELSGQTPLDSPLRLAAGRHELELRLDGFRTYRESVEVHGGQELDLEIELNEILQPWYRRWWFWTIVGSVIAGSTAAIIATVATRPRGAEFGVTVLSGEEP